VVETSPHDNNPIELTWETLETWMDHEAQAHFTGSILVVRDGEPVLRQGYGWANADQRIRNTPETIFAIGSTPIDFTIASILQLAEQRRLDLNDPITRYFDAVPDDKRGITLEHLLRGRSGLQDFHDLPGDANVDHTWIDRDEAVRRILAFDLRFPPGGGRAHSHSAFGLLAAIVEIVSGQSFQEYTRAHLYEPAGMADTGFFGAPIPEARLAVGRGEASSGRINAPPYWGPTSWLVMGSGGQTSTVDDMGRWLNALYAGKIVSAEHVARIVGPRGNYFGVGGDMFGFEINYSMAPGTFLVLISNAMDSPEKRRSLEAMSQQLRSLLPDRRNAFTVGLAFDAEGTQVVLSHVVPGSPAERDGLVEGDVLLAIAGRSLRDHDPLDILSELLTQGNAIDFDIERDGTPQTVRVTPMRRQ
jgi:CubicO group peptidase (beta-lactamase class C family)